MALILASKSHQYICFFPPSPPHFQQTEGEFGLFCISGFFYRKQTFVLPALLLLQANC